MVTHNIIYCESFLMMNQLICINISFMAEFSIFALPPGYSDVFCHSLLDITNLFFHLGSDGPGQGKIKMRASGDASLSLHYFL
ncbi:unnamed protein product, partial [Vitis vinifera]|uniref:Uncharacterized protein n=1 Tax=Vitis vinifera TaxID=29760 RepID=D7T208_VITVI